MEESSNEVKIFSVHPKHDNPVTDELNGIIVSMYNFDGII